MTKIGEKTKLLFALFIPLIMFGALLLVFTTFRTQIFFGQRSDALSILNGVVQGLSSIIAILFAIIILVVQTTLGKYVTKATRYVISDWVSILMLSLYVCTIAAALWTMWNINYELWTVWVDVVMAASLVCLSALIPFFLRMPKALNPTVIMSHIKNEILDACQENKIELMGDKTNLLFSMIRRSTQAGDVEYAFEGFRILEEIIKLGVSKESEWSFFNLLQSLLDNLGMENVMRNPRVAHRVFWVYSRICNTMKTTPPLYHNVGNRIVQSVLEICKEAKLTRFANALLERASLVIIEIYKTDMLHNYALVALKNLEESLHEILKMSNEAGVLETSPVLSMANHAIMDLLRNGRSEEALHMTEVVYDETTGSHFIEFFLVGLIVDSKAEGYDEFASMTLEIANKKFGSFEIDATYNSKLKGQTKTSVKPDGSVEIRTGNKKKKNAALWIKEELKRIG